MEALDYWRLCDELTVNQAALLVAGVDPAGYTNIEQLDPDSCPTGFDAARHAITSALRRGTVVGEIVELTDYNSYNEPCGIIPDTVNPATSRIEVDVLRNWLRGRGLKSGFFFPEGSSAPDYLDKSHPRYAPKLAAAVRAWLATDGDAAISGKSPKQALLKWLREHAAERQSPRHARPDPPTLRRPTPPRLPSFARFRRTALPRWPGSPGPLRQGV